MSNSSFVNASSWAPAEPQYEIQWERGQLVYPTWTAFCLGINTVFYGIFLHYTFLNKPLRQVAWITVIYTTVMYGLAIVYFWSTMEYTEDMYVYDRNYPGGPFAYSLIPFTPELRAATVSFVVINALGDAVFMFRCYLVWDRSKLVMIFPVLIYCASVVCSIFTVITSAALNFTLPYFGLSTGLNLFLTIMICGKLLWARKSIMVVLGKEHAKLYTSVAAMIVESALLNAVVSTVSIVLVAVVSTAANISLGTQSQVMCISPMLILIRVARGRAYSKEAIAADSTQIRFTRPHLESDTMAPESAGFAMTAAPSTNSQEFYKKTELSGYAL